MDALVASCVLLKSRHMYLRAGCDAIATYALQSSIKRLPLIAKARRKGSLVTERTTKIHNKQKARMAP